MEAAFAKTLLQKPLSYKVTAVANVKLLSESDVAELLRCVKGVLNVSAMQLVMAKRNMVHSLLNSFLCDKLIKRLHFLNNLLASVD